MPRARLALLVLSLFPTAATLAQFETAAVNATARSSTSFDDGSGLVNDSEGGTVTGVYPAYVNNAGSTQSSLIGIVSSDASVNLTMTPTTIVASGSAGTDCDNVDGELTTGVASGEASIEVTFTITIPHRWTFTSGSVNGTHAGGTVSLSAGNNPPIFSFDSIFMPFFDDETGIIGPGTYTFSAGVSSFTDINDGFNGLFADASFDINFVIAPLAPPPCEGDADGDGTIGFPDITAVLRFWGTSYAPGTGLGDADGNGLVGFPDITTVLRLFGSTCR